MVNAPNCQSEMGLTAAWLVCLGCRTATNASSHSLCWIALTRPRCLSLSWIICHSIAVKVQGLSSATFSRRQASSHLRRQFPYKAEWQGEGLGSGWTASRSKLCASDSADVTTRRRGLLKALWHWSKAQLNHMFNKEHWRPIFQSHKRVTANNFQVTCQQRLWCGKRPYFLQRLPTTKPPAGGWAGRCCSSQWPARCEWG